MILRFCLILAAAACFAFQAPEGTADRCDNFFNTPAAHRCDCNHATDCPMPGHAQAEPTNKCKTYCKPDHCHCLHPCTS